MIRTPLLATDILIEYSGGIVLIERRNPPLGLAIPGGFAELGLSLEENARKEAKEETGLEVTILNPRRPLCVRSDPERDPRGHAVSVAYVARGEGELRAGDDAADARVYSLGEIKALIEGNRLAFDHGEILRDYLEYRRRRE
jgi:ADP-ribose pyrophosphatase YjhB (NUDIX family)